MVELYHVTEEGVAPADPNADPFGELPSDGFEANLKYDPPIMEMPPPTVIIDDRDPVGPQPQPEPPPDIGGGHPDKGDEDKKKKEEKRKKKREQDCADKEQARIKECQDRWQDKYDNAVAIFEGGSGTCVTGAAYVAGGSGGTAAALAFIGGILCEAGVSVTTITMLRSNRKQLARCNAFAKEERNRCMEMPLPEDD